MRHCYTCYDYVMHSQICVKSRIQEEFYADNCDDPSTCFALVLRSSRKSTGVHHPSVKGRRMRGQRGSRCGGSGSAACAGGSPRNDGTRSCLKVKHG